MREITDIKEMQKIELDILKFIDEICEKYGIKYSLAYGTLIGAVRHRGFIPWDDDVDIMMLRKDYDQFCKVMKKEYGRYQLLCIENTTKYDLPLAKVIDTSTLLIQYQTEKSAYDLGIYVDVFPMDRVSANKLLWNFQYIFAVGLSRIWSAAQFKTNLSAFKEESLTKHILRICCNKLINTTIGRRKVVQFISKVSRIFNCTDYGLVASVSFGINKKRIYLSDWLLDLIGTDFCGKNFPISKSFNEILTLEYGDYMTLPPKEQQVSNHSFVAYWKE